MKDYYAILGVAATASAAEIKSAYRRLAMKYHPDRNSSPEAEAEFKKINQANEVLSDPEKRQRYDVERKFGSFNANFQSNSQGTGGSANFSSGADIWDVFENMFGQEGFSFFRDGASVNTAQTSPEETTVSLNLTFAEFINGAKKKIKVRDYTACAACEGQGRKNMTKKADCPRCRGTGQYTVSQGNLKVFMGTCPYCQGQTKFMVMNALTVPAKGEPRPPRH